MKDHLRALVAGVAALALLASPALAEKLKFRATMGSGSLVSMMNLTGSGSLQATYDTDTKVFTWTIKYKNLSGAVTSGEIHGPVADGAAPEPIIALVPPFDSPLSGSATLTDEQASDLRNGQWYVTLGTEKFAQGEVRGQLKEWHV